jgi:predicted RNase H-like nuclease (RuvC/YqgF family)
MAAVQYKISFVPESNYGCITKKTTNRKEAYSIYREIKQQIGEVRPGQLCIFEILDDGTERYLCRYRTGQNRNGKVIVQDIKKQVKKLHKIYNPEYLNNKMSEYSKIQSNLIHGIELMDMTKVDPYVFAKHVIEKQEMVAHLRRQYKSDLYDAKALENDLKDLMKLINKISANITNLKQYRLVTDTNKPNLAQISYLEALGVDVGAYCHNANPEEVLPLGQLIKDIEEIGEED